MLGMLLLRHAARGTVEKLHLTPCARLVGSAILRATSNILSQASRQLARHLPARLHVAMKWHVWCFCDEMDSLPE